jgi:hypothetical protein
LINTDSFAGLQASYPTFQGYGTQEGILPRCYYLIPVRGNTHDRTNTPMMVLDV